MAYQNIAIAGATGNLGPTIVNELLHQGFTLTILSRSDTAPSLPSSVKVLKVDFTSQTSLTTALQNQDVLISTLPNQSDQPFLIDAAITAGVKRFIPSEFGSNVPSNEKVRSLPVFAGKVSTEQYLQEKKSQISYTFIVNGLFLDWGFQHGFIVNRKGVTRVVDRGDAKLSTTSLADIGRTVAGVLKHPKETENRAVYVQSASITQNKLIELVRKIKPEFKAEVEHVSSEQVLQDSYAELAKENVGEAMLGFILVSILGEGYGSDWSDKLDNELLGIKGLSDDELEEFARKYL